MPSGPRRLSEALASSTGHLGEALRHARRIQALDRTFAREAGYPLATYCRVANVSTDTLTVHAHSSAWGAKLRFRLPAILESLRREPGCSDLQRIQVRVRPSSPEPSRPHRGRRELSPSSSRLLQEVAANTPHSRLREALLRLSRHTDKSRP